MNREEVLAYIEAQEPLWAINKATEMPHQIMYPLTLNPIQIRFQLVRASEFYVRGTSTGFLVSALTGPKGQVRHYFTSYESCRDVCIEWKKAQIKELEKDLAVLQGTEAPK